MPDDVVITCRLDRRATVPNENDEVVDNPQRNILTLSKDPAPAADAPTEIPVGATPWTLDIFRRAARHLVCVADTATDTTGAARLWLVSLPPDLDQARVEADVKIPAEAGPPVAVACDPQDTFAAVACKNKIAWVTVDWADPSRSAVTFSPPLPAAPAALVFDPAGAFLVAALPDQHAVQLLTLDRSDPSASDTATLTLEAPGYDGPQWLGISPDGSIISTICPTEDYSDGAAVWIEINRSDPAQSAIAAPQPIGLDVRQAIPSQTDFVSVTVEEPMAWPVTSPG
ncbi:hypothetical protein [Streptomyces yunnanensis]|uniref:Uncharacterized protein n=1 Tax=Streptomyces yunnanensis TaxID=156453 RepID=A0A9X8R0A0_9ACTN|nr:hypothetical protein [Streptomyces yunnanensis]SHN32353.1 hypothetical protein SAMN05216268_1369 [Streptomyces yunnanensis]